MKIPVKRITALFSLLFLTNASAFAQTPVPSSPSNDANSCTPPAQDKPKSDKAEPLGEKLADSKGVICPPQGHDPNIKVPPPDSGAKMPVIKPPSNAK